MLKEITTAQPWLRRFLLNQDSQEWRDGWRVFVYYNLEGKLRYTSGATRINTETGISTMLSEISYPPFGYVLSMHGAPPDTRLTEVTRFVRYAYTERAPELVLPMSVLPTHLLYPGDYRTRDEIEVGRKRSSAT